MNRKAELFVQEYLKDLNATQAAIRAGYSKKTAHSIGAENLKKPEIARAIKEAQDARAKANAVSQDQIIQELKCIAFGNMGNLARWNESGVRYLPSEDLSPEALASIQSVEETTNQHGGSLKIKQHDKLRALELLGKHLGMFTDRVELSGNLNRPNKDVSDEDLAKAISRDA